MQFNPMQQVLIQQRLGFSLSDEESSFQHGMYVEDDMLEFIGSGDRLWLVGGEIQVVKYGDIATPVEIHGQEFSLMDRREFKFPATKLATALSLFLSGNM